MKADSFILKSLFVESIIGNKAESDLTGPINYARRVVSGWAKAHKAEMRRVFEKVLSIGAIDESLPNPKSYIDQARDKTDDNDLPIARINSYLPEMEIKPIEFMAGKCREILAACGVSRLFEEYGSYDAFNSTHVFGTCRMGKC